MENVIFRTSLLRGPKGDRGETGAPDSVPKDGVIAYDGDDLPEGYVEIEELDVYGDLMNEMASLDARLDIVESLPEGSTTMDAELVDIRYGANGKTYQTAGKAVRGQIDEVNENMEWYQEKDKTLIDNATLTGQASGEVASFDMGGDAPLKECVIQIEPKQDLHGQDYPYPAGAGKNKIPMTVDGLKAANTSGTWSGNTYTLNGVTFTIQTDDGGNVTKIETGGTTSESIYHFVIGEDIVLNGNYKFTSGNTNPWSGYNYLCLAIDSNNTEYVPTSNDGVELPSGTYKVVIGIALNTNVDGKAFYPMIRDAADTDPTFVSPSNICPIGGYYQAKVNAVGENMFDNSTFEKGIIIDGTIGYSEGTTSLTVENGGVSFTTNTNWRGVYSGLIPVLPNSNYFWSWTESDNVGSYVDYFDANGDWISNAYYQQTNYFTTPSNAAYIRLSYQKPTAGSISISNIMLAPGTARADFVPYNGYTKPVPFSNKNLLPCHLKYDSFDIWSGAQALKEINPSDTNKHWFGDEYDMDGCYVIIETEEDKDTIKEIRISRSEADPGNNLSFKLYDKIAAQAYDFEQSVDLTVGGAQLSDNLYLLVLTFDGEYTHETVFNSGDIVQLPENLMYKCSIVIKGAWSGEITLKPMISPHSDTDKTFMPYYNGLQLNGEKVYKGYVDPVNMRLTVAGIIVKLSDLTEEGFENGTYSTCYRAQLSDRSTTVQISEKHGAICDTLREENAYFGAPRPNEEYTGNGSPFFAINTTGEIVAIYDKDTSISKSDFLAKYGDIEICYPLADPNTYGINNTELKSILGVNNISADTGEIAVTFRKDANLVINSLIARIEALEGGS